MKKYILILVVTLGALFVLVGVYVLGYGSVISLRQSVAKLDTQVRWKQELLARSGTETKTIVSLIKDESVLNRYIVTDVSVVKFLNVFEAIGRATGAAVSVVSVSKEKQVGKPIFAISITAQGSFASVMNTVGAIENMPYYITTNMVSLSNSQIPGQIETQANKKIQPWSASMTLTVAATNAVATTTPSVATTTVSIATTTLTTTTSTTTKPDVIHTTP